MASALQRRARKDRTGREQRRRSPVAVARKPNLSKFYGRRLPAITPGDFEFALDLLRGVGKPVPIDTFTESFEWVDEDAGMTGSLQLHRPDVETWRSLPIGLGHRVRCRTRWAGRWYEVWTMRCDAPEVTVEDGTVSVALKDDLALVRGSRRRYVFRRTKRRPHGYFGHEMLRDAAKRDGIKLGAIARCSKRMSKVDVTGSFLDLAVKVYEHERQVTGHKFILRMRDGKFEAVTYRRNRTLYVLADELRSAVVRQQPKVENPATVLTGVGRVGKGSSAKKIRFTEYRRDVVRRLGYRHKTKNYGKVDSPADLREKVRRDLARELRVEETCTVQFGGIPFIRRGDGCQVVIRSDRFTGADSFVYATALRHQVQGGTYTTEGDFTREDAFLADQQRQEKEARDRARRARQKRKRS